MKIKKIKKLFKKKIKNKIKGKIKILISKKLRNEIVDYFFFKSFF